MKNVLTALTLIIACSACNNDTTQSNDQPSGDVQPIAATPTPTPVPTPVPGPCAGSSLLGTNRTVDVNGSSINKVTADDQCNLIATSDQDQCSVSGTFTDNTQGQQSGNFTLIANQANCSNTGAGTATFTYSVDANGLLHVNY